MGDVLIAKDGYIYTNGNDIYGRELYLAKGRSKDEFYLISIEEYELMTAESEVEEVGTGDI